MHKITKLPDHIQKIICAGEVITSPYNVLKELIENSIDAGSSTIKINISKDTLTIEVHDNGSGMQKNDFSNLCKPHHTSKFDHSMNFNLHFGFRGEALASICCVSHMTIKSKQKESDVGYSKECRDGRIIPVSMNDGTSIIIKHLFYNNKIREKCYSKSSTEYKKCHELIYSFIVKFFTIRFYINEVYVGTTEDTKLIDESSDNKKNMTVCAKSPVHTKFREILEYAIKNFIFSSSVDDKRRCLVVQTVYKIDKLKRYSNEFMSLLFTPSDINYKKFVFILFVNNRLVSHLNIKDFIYKKYQEILPKHRYPFVYMDLTIPSENIDVNVHPSKKEVMFDCEDLILEVLEKALDAGLNESRTLSQPNLISKVSSPVNIIYKEPDTLDMICTPKKHVRYNLLSINKMKQEFVEVDAEFIRSLVYIGIFANKFLLVQYNQYLMKTDLHAFKGHFLRQYFVYNFGNLEKVSVNINIKHEVRHKEMLSEYFSIKIVGNVIKEIPLIGKFYNDNVEDWDKFNIKESQEEAVFREVINQLVDLYQTLTIDKCIFALCRVHMKSTRELVESFGILTSLKDLYKSFERC